MNNDDQKLQSLYRNVSHEAAPKHLDDKILRLSRQRPQQNWQPFALAATVLLSFAFVANLDVAEMESPEALLPPATSSLPEAEARADMLVADEQVAATAQRELPATLEKAQQSATVAPAVDVRAANSAPHAVESLRRSRQLDTAGEAFVDAAAKRMRAATPRHCSEAATAAPGSWYDCVLSLRKRDMTDEANAEQSRLLTKFPDFQIR